MTQTVPSHELTLARAYAACRSIAKREAKNFYYAFVALPLERRNAICAIYAFMRQADDLADDETLPREERRRLLDAWLAAWREAASGEATSDPVFLAVRDATQRFKIPLELLDELVAGVTMDLDHATSRRARHLRDLCRSLSLLLSGRVRRRPGLHPHLRLPRPARGKARRRNRHRLPAHQHPARCGRGRGAQSRLSASR